jgi:hypothetical protein
VNRAPPPDVLLISDLISNEETYPLIGALSHRPYLSAEEVIAPDLPAKNRVGALLRHEFLTERQLRELACDFVEHVLRREPSGFTFAYPESRDL